MKDEIKEHRSSRESSQEVSSVRLRANSSEQLNKSTDSLKSSDSSEFASLTKSRLSFKKNIKVGNENPVEPTRFFHYHSSNPLS